MTTEQEKTAETVNDKIIDAVDDLAKHFRQVSRGRIVELPRWAR